MAPGIGGADDGGSGSGPGAVQENDSGPGYMVSVLCSLRGCAGKGTPGTIARPDGLPASNCKGQPEVPVALLAGL